MKNNILKKVYLLLATVFLGIILKITTIQVSTLNREKDYYRDDLKERAITQYVEDDVKWSSEDYLLEEEEPNYDIPKYETLLEKQVNQEKKEALRLFRNPKFILAAVTNNGHKIMIQLQKEYLEGNISEGLIESIIFNNAFKLSEEDIEKLRKLIGTPGNGIGSKTLL